MINDPLAELSHEIAPGVILKYPNRLLWLIAYDCPSKCPFCFRKELNSKRKLVSSLETVMEVIKTHPTVKEVIFSGGEPLVEMGKVEEAIKTLAKLPQIKVFRIHSRLPITYPNQVMEQGLMELPKMIDQPLYFVLHVNQVLELKRVEVRELIARLRRSGFILLSQSVFLRGVNDGVELMVELLEELVAMGVKPYYVFHCDNMPHTQKWIVSLKTEVEIMTEVRKRVSGLAYPLHVLDTATGAGKIPMPTGFWKTNLDRYADFSDEWQKS